ncbi:MAG: M20 family metallopeptidase [Acidobacteriaceae bacterium]
MTSFDAVAFTRQLVDIESVTGNEGPVAELLASKLLEMAYTVERIPCELDRFNVYAVPKGGKKPDVVFSTHIDTVPPYMPSSEDAQNIYGRGSCDAKGIVAAQIAAVEQLRVSDENAALLFLVGEERDSLGARVANQHSPGSRFLINGEPTDNRIAVASKGALRVELIADGKMAHSAYPELGESAIEKLVRALGMLLEMSLPHKRDVGPCTMNIGLIEGGRAPNVIPDRAKAELLFRLVDDSAALREQISEAVRGLARPEFTVEIPFVRLRTVPGIQTMIAAFTTDIPALTNWGEPILLGPGSIHVAHTPHEFLAKRELFECIDLYVRTAKRLLS